jgi:hypothetical protein
MVSRKTSESGAYMSQYDTEVEKRLKVLEAAVKELTEASKAKKQTPAAPVNTSGLEEKFNLLLKILKMNPVHNIEKLSKGQL